MGANEVGEMRVGGMRLSRRAKWPNFECAGVRGRGLQRVVDTVVHHPDLYSGDMIGSLD